MSASAAVSPSSRARNGSAVEDYLKAVFNLAEWDDELSNRAIADRLGVSPRRPRR